MRRIAKIMALACAQALLFGLPALAEAPNPPVPDPGADYMLEAPPSVRHSWTPGAEAGAVVSSARKVNSVITFSSGTGGGERGGTGESAQKAQEVSGSRKVSTKGTKTAPHAVDMGPLFRLLAAGALDYSDGAVKLFQARLITKGGQDTIEFRAYQGLELLDGKDSSVPISQNNPAGSARNASVQITDIRADGATLVGNFSGPNGSSSNLTGSPSDE